MPNFRDALSHNVPIVDELGRPTPEFMAKWQQQTRINKAIPAEISTPEQVSAILDLLAATPGALLRRGAAQWQALNSLGDATKFLNGAGAYSLPVPLNAKGQVLGTTGAALGTLAPGTDSQVLTADATQPLGFKWAPGGGGGGSSAPNAADFPFTFNRNGSVVDTVEGLVFDAGSPGTGDVAGAVCKVAPSGEFQVDANVIIGRAILGNWAGLGVGMYGSGSYYFAGPRFDSGYSIAGHKNNNSGGHVDLSNVDNYGRGILGGWIQVRRFKPAPGALLVGVNLAVGATNCAFTGWTSQQARNLASASGCLSTTTGFTPSTGLNIGVTSSVSANQSLTVLPINSLDGSTAPSLRSTASDAKAWALVDVPIPAGTQTGDAMIIGVRHQFGVLFDKAREWSIQSNFSGINNDGSSLCVSKVLTAADIAVGYVTFRSTQLGNGCWFVAVVKVGTFSSVGVTMAYFVGGTSNTLSSDNISLAYSTDQFWMHLINLTPWSSYFSAPPTHVGFCSWFNRTAGPISLICKAWRQSW